MGTEAVTPVDVGWCGDRADSRDLLIRCLNLAEIEDDIIEDIADACEVTGYSPAALASEDVVMETVAERVFLTEQEAAKLIEVCRAEVSKVAAAGAGRKAGAREAIRRPPQDVLADGLEGFDGWKAGLNTSPAKGAQGGPGGDWQGVPRPNQTVIHGGSCMAARFFPINRFIESKSPPFESTHHKFGKPSAGMSGGFKPFETKAPPADELKAAGARAYRPAAISAKLQSWTAGPPGSNLLAKGGPKGTDAKEPRRGGNQLKAYKPAAGNRHGSGDEDEEDDSEPEARQVYTFKTQGKVGGSATSTSPFWKASAKPAAGFFSLPAGGAGRPASPDSSCSDSDETCSAGLPALAPRDRSPARACRFTQGASFGSKAQSASRRSGPSGASRGGRPRVPRLKLPQFGTPVGAEIGKCAGAYIASSDESVDTVVTEGSARSQSTASSWQEASEAPRRAGSLPKACREVMYPWGEGGVEPCVRGATWTAGQAEGKAGRKGRPKLRRSGSNDSKRSSDTTCTWRTNSSGTPSLSRQGSGSSQGSSVVGGTPPRNSKSSSSFMLPTTASKARADTKAGSSSSAHPKTESKEGARRGSRARGSRPFKPQQHRRTVSAMSQFSTVPKVANLSKDSRGGRPAGQPKQKLYGGDVPGKLPRVRSSPRIECLAAGAWK